MSQQQQQTAQQPPQLHQQHASQQQTSTITAVARPELTGKVPMALAGARLSIPVSGQVLTSLFSFTF